eukprot:CAMPEP_0115870936 /NCGR_PEP_ID=MMETSP0287-20121206/22598_1 /TAXON_ID=412157 /ORGANISM="Chrysochromulina rotalis, Strain UIO044" /LENGTH=151 /DNA_ID=CAMNT_0003325703 /DNA_START=343 /DNA_END=796 /DNA_ORIENTATION=-
MAQSAGCVQGSPGRISPSGQYSTCGGRGDVQGVTKPLDFPTAKRTSRPTAAAMQRPQPNRCDAMLHSSSVNTSIHMFVQDPVMHGSMQNGQSKQLVDSHPVLEQNRPKRRIPRGRVHAPTDGSSMSATKSAASQSTGRRGVRARRLKCAVR